MRAAKAMQERIGVPPTSTVHAPHSPRPHASLVPRKPIKFRSACSSVVSGGASSACAVPLTRSEITAPSLPRNARTARSLIGPRRETGDVAASDAPAGEALGDVAASLIEKPPERAELARRVKPRDRLIEASDHALACVVYRTAMGVGKDRP